MSYLRKTFSTIFLISLIAATYARATDTFAGFTDPQTTDNIRREFSLLYQKTYDIKHTSRRIFSPQEINHALFEARMEQYKAAFNTKKIFLKHLITLGRVDNSHR